MGTHIPLTLLADSRHPDDGGSIGCCGYILSAFSYLLVILFFPFSLVACIKVSKLRLALDKVAIL